MEWLWLIPILFFLVLTHEFGHFVTARWFGVTVHEFGIGFPPKALTIARRNGVDYTLNWLPIGGFVRMEGEDGDSKDPNAFNRKPGWQRLIILASGSVINLLTALLIFIGLSLGGANVPQYQTAIYSLEAGGPAAQAGLKPGDVVLMANDSAIKSISDLVMVVNLEANTNVRLSILRNGQPQTISIVPRSVDLGSGKGAIGVVLMPYFDDLRVQSLDPNSVAYKQGLKDNDVITAVDNKDVKNSYDIIKQLEGKTTVSLVVQRAGSSETITGVPVSNDYVITAAPNGSALQQAGFQAGDLITKVDGKAVSNRYDVDTIVQNLSTLTTTVTVKHKDGSEATLPNVPTATLSNNGGSPIPPAWLADVNSAPVKHVAYSFGEAVGSGLNRTGENVGLIFNSLKAIVQGSQPLKNLSGPVGIGKLTGDVVKNGGGFGGLLALMGLLGANLFFVNMLPFPALDGGRFFFVLIEMVTRRRVPPNVEGAINLVGFALLMIFILYVSFYDVARTFFS